jgi:hypothetical protein
LWWIPSKRGLFKVKVLYHFLGCNVGRSFPWKSVWRTQASPRAAFFVCSTRLGKILTLDNLRKRQVIVINRCGMYKSSKETVDHLLLYCEVASTLCDAIFSCFGVAWVMPRRVVVLLACWWSSGGRRSATVWKMVPTCLFWCFWQERNNRCFEDLERSF